MGRKKPLTPLFLLEKKTIQKITEVSDEKEIQEVKFSPNVFQESEEKVTKVKIKEPNKLKASFRMEIEKN